jgi:hypothetical protein
MSNIITIFCILHGNASARAFPVKIDTSKSIAALKEEVWKKKQRELGDYDPDRLDIWRVDIDYATQNPRRTAYQNDINADIQSVLQGVRADKTYDVVDVFGNGPLPKKHIHAIIVVRPPGK